MFYFTMGLGVLLVILGLLKRNQEVEARLLGKDSFYPKPLAESKEPSIGSIQEEDFMDLEDRMETLEKTLFDQLMSWEEEKQMLLQQLDRDKVNTEEKEEQRLEEVEVEPVKEKKPMPDHIRVILDYEREGFSVEEIAKKAGINKGEVLLLKNLSKHYKE